MWPTFSEAVSLARKLTLHHQAGRTTIEASRAASRGCLAYVRPVENRLEAPMTSGKGSAAAAERVTVSAEWDVSVAVWKIPADRDIPEWEYFY